MRPVHLFLVSGSTLIVALLVGSVSNCAEPDIDKLIRQLGSPQFEERERATKELKAAAALAVEQLQKASKSADPEIAKRAGECLPLAERRAAVAELIATVKKGNPKERCAGLDGLMGIARADRGGPNKRVNVIFGAEHLASLASDSVPVLLTSLGDENPDVRLAAINALWGFGPSAEKAVPKLVGILNDPKKEEFHRAASAHTLNEIGSAAEIAVPALVQLVKTERPGVLKNAAGTALGTLAKSDNEVIPLLLKGLNDESDVAFQSCAALSLGILGKAPQDCVPALTERLRKHKGYQTGGGKAADPRIAALIALGHFGSEAKASTPVVLEIAKDPNEDRFLRLRAVNASGQLRPADKNTTSFLIGLLSDSQCHHALRIESIIALGNIGPDMKEAVALLRELAKQPLFAKDATQALGQIER